MNDSVTGDTNREKPFGNGGGQEYCSDCRGIIPAGATFCPHCGPPNPPEEEPDVGMSFGQAGFRILLIVLVFGAVALFKIDFDFAGFGENEEVTSIPLQAPPGAEGIKPHSVDYKTIHNVRTIKAQMREKPEDNAKLVVTLKKGTRVTILDGTEEWWKINFKGQSGWVPKETLDTEVQ